MFVNLSPEVRARVVVEILLQLWGKESTSNQCLKFKIQIPVVQRGHCKSNQVLITEKKVLDALFENGVLGCILQLYCQITFSPWAYFGHYSASLFTQGWIKPNFTVCFKVAPGKRASSGQEDAKLFLLLTSNICISVVYIPKSNNHI